MSRNGSGVYSLPAGSTITNGDISDASDLNTPLQDIAADLNVARPIVAGGTGAVTVAQARTNLGLEIGTDVQAYDATLTSIAALGTAADKFAYTTGVDTWAEATVTSFARTLLDDTTAADARTTLGAVDSTAVDAAIAAEVGGDFSSYTPTVLDTGTSNAFTLSTLGNTLIYKTINGITFVQGQIVFDTVPGTRTGVPLISLPVAGKSDATSGVAIQWNGSVYFKDFSNSANNDFKYALIAEGVDDIQVDGLASSAVSASDTITIAIAYATGD